jgi:small-conductance mechanosensitive channel
MQVKATMVRVATVAMTVVAPIGMVGLRDGLGAQASILSLVGSTL